MNGVPAAASPVAVIGAGVAGLVCAERLAQAGLAVQLFDKSRGVGGRLSHRRYPAWSADHGAPVFHARSEAFRAQVLRWQAQGAVAPWPAVAEAAPGLGAWVGLPRMSAPASLLAQGLAVQTGVTVTALERTPAGWQLRSQEQGLLPACFGQVVIALPAPQAEALLAAHAPEFAAAARTVRMLPCWTLLLRFAVAQPLPFDWWAAGSAAEVLALAIRDSAKPGREPPAGGGEIWVVHASAEWSQRWLEVSPARATQALLDAFRALGGGEPAECVAHRWRYASVPVVRPPPAQRALARAGLPWLASRGLGVCGDWVAGLADPSSDGVEAAWSSGVALAERMLLSTAASSGPAGRS